MIAAAIVLAIAAAVILAAKPLCAWADRDVEAQVEQVLGPRVDWDAAQKAWESQGKSQLR